MWWMALAVGGAKSFSYPMNMQKKHTQKLNSRNVFHCDVGKNSFPSRTGFVADTTDSFASTPMLKTD